MDAPTDSPLARAIVLLLSAEMKAAIYADLATRLSKECGIPRTDLIVSCNENTRSVDPLSHSSESSKLTVLIRLLHFPGPTGRSERADSSSCAETFRVLSVEAR